MSASQRVSRIWISHLSFSSLYRFLPFFSVLSPKGLKKWGNKDDLQTSSSDAENIIKKHEFTIEISLDRSWWCNKQMNQFKQQEYWSYHNNYSSKSSQSCKTENYSVHNFGNNIITIIKSKLTRGLSKLSLLWVRSTDVTVWNHKEAP